MTSAEQLVATATALIEARDNFNDARSRYEEYAAEASHIVQDTFVGVVPWIKRMLYLAAVTCFLLVLSAATYSFLYVFIMPSNYVTKPLYFDYTKSSAKSKSCIYSKQDDLINKTGCLAEEVSSYFKKTLLESADADLKKTHHRPIAEVDLFARHVQWEALHTDASPSITMPNLLNPGQEYFFEIALVIPESKRNRNAGVFGVSCELSSGDEMMTPLARSTRSAILPYESPMIESARKSFFILPLLLGGMKESRTIVIPSFRHFVESKNYPLRRVKVQLIMQDETTGGADTVEVESGEIRIGKELNLVQTIVREWFYTCFVIGTGVFFSIYTLIWLVLDAMLQSWRGERRQRRQSNPEWEEEPTVGYVNGQDFHDAREGNEGEGEEQRPQRWEYASVGGQWDGDSWEPTSPQEDSQNGRDDAENTNEESQRTHQGSNHDATSIVSID